MGTINSSDRIAVFLRDMVCLRNICIHTLHKGDSIFTNNNNNNNLHFALSIKRKTSLLLELSATESHSYYRIKIEVFLGREISYKVKDRTAFCRCCLIYFSKIIACHMINKGPTNTSKYQCISTSVHCYMFQLIKVPSSGSTM
jgi:hypothetical protein